MPIAHANPFEVLGLILDSLFFVLPYAKSK